MLSVLGNPYGSQSAMLARVYVWNNLSGRSDYGKLQRRISFLYQCSEDTANLLLGLVASLSQHLAGTQEQVLACPQVEQPQEVTCEDIPLRKEGNTVTKKQHVLEAYPYCRIRCNPSVAPVLCSCWLDTETLGQQFARNSAWMAGCYVLLLHNSSAALPSHFSVSGKQLPINLWYFLILRAHLLGHIYSRFIYVYHWIE